MNITRISKAMSFIDDELISEAQDYKPRSSGVITTIKIATVAFAACLILAIVFYPKQKPDFPIAFTSTTSANAEVLYAHEVYDHKVFGRYFPTDFAKGYTPIGKVYIYNYCLEAEFYNPKTQDTISLTITPKELSPADETSDTVHYTVNKVTDVYSYIKLDVGNYVVHYTSEKEDLNTLEGFDKMIDNIK